MIDVYVRQDLEEGGHWLGAFKPDALEGLVKTVKMWGCYFPETGDLLFGNACGQFTIRDNGRTVFEIVMCDDDE